MERPRSIGLISDTHGLLRPEAVAALAGSDLVLHAGDVGAPEVLAALARVGPVVAVRGNNDHGPWAEKLPAVEVVAVGEIQIYLLHDVQEIDLDPRAAGFAAVVSGHSHRPSVTRRDGVLFVNPGSAGPRRFTLPVAVARLTVAGGAVTAEILPLAV